MKRIGLLAQLACIWEVTARKPGNVHRYADFADVHYLDFVLSAAAIAPVLETAIQRPVGETIHQAVQATRQVVRTNTNLGIILLLAPLAAISLDQPLSPALEQVLDELTVQDSRLVFQAIRLANPGGIGETEEQDLSGEPTLPLRQIMALAAERDMIARQYVNGYQEVLTCGVPALLEGLERFGALEEAIIHCHLTLMAKYPDSLIARKRGLAEAQEAAKRARSVLQAKENRSTQIADLDRWLREQGHKRNPGTTADLVTASLFVALRENKIHYPLQCPWSGGSVQ